MSTFTPIKVRGKRSATRDEKWTSGKRHRNGLTIEALVSVDISDPSKPYDLAEGSGSKPRKRRRRLPHLSRLEVLPTEILQVIFDYSTNINLAFASPRLKDQLRSQHLHSQLTSHILGAVLNRDDDHITSDTELATATRLLGCKFMTWAFFKSWLQEQHAGVFRTTDHYLTAWSELRPAQGLLPPVKLLHGPWTSERTSFLRIFSREIGDLAALSSMHHETAANGISQAVAESARDAVGTLLSMGVKPTTELLRQAVIDHGCDKDIVIALLSTSTSNHESARTNSSTIIDLLDAALWAWSDNARQNGDEKGDWLIRLLKSKATDYSVGRMQLHDTEVNVAEA
ncbi:hypothetical protein LTR86_003300 [Recurvomyces mirabilis]|nr:hypothetical protein LTR86_003300 [Recurvomyces mirabilis]